MASSYAYRNVRSNKALSAGISAYLPACPVYKYHALTDFVKKKFSKHNAIARDEMKNNYFGLEI
jgi:hypothetical protein